MTLIIGHKGAPTLEAENTVSSFARARDLGADGVELDVRRTGDGALAVWHDPVLADGQVLLEQTRAQLDGAVDYLADVLDTCAGLDLVNVEIKNWPADADFDQDYGIAEVTARQLAVRPASERASFVVSCFHPPTLARARKWLDEVAPEIRTGWLLWGVDDVEQVVSTAVAGRHAALHPFFTAVTPELIDQAHAAKLAIHCWTLNDLDEVRRQADLGIDGIITDRPAEALAALREGPG